MRPAWKICSANNNRLSASWPLRRQPASLLGRNQLSGSYIAHSCSDVWYNIYLQVHPRLLGWSQVLQISCEPLVANMVDTLRPGCSSFRRLEVTSVSAAEEKRCGKRVLGRQVGVQRHRIIVGFVNSAGLYLLQLSNVESSPNTRFRAHCGKTYQQ